jgi:hypothetical protein
MTRRSALISLAHASNVSPTASTKLLLLGNLALHAMARESCADIGGGNVLSKFALRLGINRWNLQGVHQ